MHILVMQFSMQSICNLVMHILFRYRIAKFNHGLIQKRFLMQALFPQD